MPVVRLLFILLKISTEWSGLVLFNNKFANSILTRDSDSDCRTIEGGRKAKSLNKWNGVDGSILRTVPYYAGGNLDNDFCD